MLNFAYSARLQFNPPLLQFLGLSDGTFFASEFRLVLVEPVVILCVNQSVAPGRFAAIGTYDIVFDLPFRGIAVEISKPYPFHYDLIVFKQRAGFRKSID